MSPEESSSVPPTSPGAEAASAGGAAARFEAAFNQPAVGMTIVNAQGRLLDINDAFCRIVGRPREELVGRTTAHYTHPDDREPSAQTVVVAGRTGNAGQVVEKRYLRPDGAVVWARASLSVVDRGPDGQPKQFIGVVEDISARKVAQEAVQAGEDSLRRVLESVQDYAIFTFDPEGRVTSWNVGAERLFGYSEADILGQNSTMLWTPEDRAEGVPITEREAAYRTGHGQDEGWRQRKDGTRFYARGNVTPLRDGTGRLFGYTKVCRDVTVQRDTELALARTRARLDSALIAGEVATFVWEVPEDRLYGDDNLARMFDVVTDQDGAAPIGVFMRAIHPEDRARVQRLVEETLAGPHHYHAEYRVRGRDHERWINARGQMERDGEGNPTRLAGVILDITERVRADAALRESEARFRFLSEISEEIRQLDDPGAVMDKVTRTLGERLQVSRCGYAEVSPDVDGFLVFPDYTLGCATMAGEHRLKRFGSRTAEALRAGRTLVLEAVSLDLPPEDGGDTFRAAEIEAVVCCPLLEHGRLAAMLAVHQTTARAWTPAEVALVEAVAERSWSSIQRVRDALELRGRERQLSFTIKAAQLGTFDWSLPYPEGKIYWNDKLKEFFWLPPEAGEVGPAVIDTKIHPEDRGRIKEAVAAAITEERRYDIEYRVLGPEGQVRWLQAKGEAYDGGPGRGKRFSGVVTDVTATRVAAEERERLLALERAARAEAERSSRMKDEFLATLSHELRTPLNAILGWAQVLRSEPPGPEDLVQGLEIIERNARAQTQIIEDLLDMSRIISGKVRLDIMRIDLPSVVEQAIETVRPSAAARGIRLQTVLDHGASPLSGDPNRLQQVFWNLLSNAIKFTPKGGRVLALLERVNSHLEFRVVDSGEGIDVTFLPHVFDRFRQQDASTSRRHGGLGLGLAIVKQIVELHGGSVSAHSAGPGQGSTFVVKLPLAVLQPEEPADERRHPQAEFAALASAGADIRLDGVKVLVVDDEADARALVKRLLEDRHATVTTAGSAAEALALLQEGRPDVLVSDIGMPGEDGYGLIRRIRALDPRTGGATPAVALTAYARSEDRMKVILAGFQMHVSKPVEAAELLTMVASLAGRT